MADGTAGWAGFATAALNALGRSAPWVVIGCLAAFGIYVLQKQSQENFTQLRTIAADERRLAASDFQAANQTLQETYSSVKTLTDAMMNSFQSQLTQLRALEDSVRAKQAEVFDRRIEVEKTLAEIANQRTELERSRGELNQLTTTLEARKEELEQAVDARVQAELDRKAALNDAEELRSELASEQSRLEETRATLVQNRQQLDEVSRQLDGRKAELDQAVARMRDVVAVLKDVASTDPDTISADLAALQERARELVPQVSDFLAAYIEQPENRNTLDPTSIIGASLNELKDAMKDMESVDWYIDSSRDNLTDEIIGVPGEAHESSGVPYAIYISMSSGVELEQLHAYLKSDTDSTFDQITISSVRLGSSVAFGCIDTGSYRNVRKCRIAEKRPGWTSESAVKFSFVLNFHDTIPVFGTEDPAIRVLAASEAAQFARTYGLSDQLDTINRYLPFLTLTFAEHLNRLSRLKINLVSADVSQAERTKLSPWISAHYARVFHPDYDFVTPVVFVPGDQKRSDLIASFVSELAVEALLRDTEVIELPVVRTKTGFRMQLPEQENTSEVGIRRLTVELKAETGEFSVSEGG